MNGQWAFAIWDTKKRDCSFARSSRVRPLFYTTAGHSFVFGSELKAVLAHPSVDRDIRYTRAWSIFTSGFAGARTVFKNHSRAPTRTSLIIEDGVLAFLGIGTDFAQRNAATLDSPKDEKRYESELCDLLLDATRIRLRADVLRRLLPERWLGLVIVTALAQKFVGSSL